MCFFLKQKTAYEMRISDWSSDVCSSDLIGGRAGADPGRRLILDQPCRPIEDVEADQQQQQIDEQRHVVVGDGAVEDELIGNRQGKVETDLNEESQHEKQAETGHREGHEGRLTEDLQTRHLHTINLITRLTTT